MSPARRSTSTAGARRWCEPRANAGPWRAPLHRANTNPCDASDAKPNVCEVTEPAAASMVCEVATSQGTACGRLRSEFSARRRRRAVQDPPVAAAAPGGMRRTVRLLHPRSRRDHRRMTRDGGVDWLCGLYAGRDRGRACAQLLPPDFRLLPQCEGDFGMRLATAMRELLEVHAGAILVNSDSPTLPASILRAAVDATRRGDAVVLSPALDGGYTLIGLSKMHDACSSTSRGALREVHERTVERAAEIGLPVDERARLVRCGRCRVARAARSELAGERPPFASPA